MTFSVLSKYRVPTMQNRFERFDITPYQEIIFSVFVFNSIHDSTTCGIYAPGNYPQSGC